MIIPKGSYISERCKLEAKRAIGLDVEMVRNAASFTPNIALPNGTALLRVLCVSGDEGVQPAQGAVVGPDQGADDDPLPSVNLHPPLAIA